MYRYGKIFSRTIHDPNEFIFKDDICKIILYASNGSIVTHAIIDREDFNKVKNLKWHLSHYGYIVSSYERGKSLWLHRVLLGLGRNDPEVDHKNRNTLDNRKANLRLATSSQNSQNMAIGRSNTSGYKGVSWHKQSQKWESYLDLNCKRIHLGMFDSKKDAAMAYNAGAKKNFGEFARINIIQ